MFLSIITINRNNAEGLKKTLDSVASQTCRDFEHIIIDGASTDDSVDIIKNYVASPAGKNVSYWVSEPDKGVYNAMNKGIKKATGKYISILNSGDCYTKDALDFFYDFCFEDSLPVLYGAINNICNGKFIGVEGGCSDDLPKRMIAHPAAFVPKILHDKYGLYSENYKIASDYEFFLKLYLGQEKFVYINKLICNFDKSGISNINKKVYKETRMIQKKLGVLSCQTFKEKITNFLFYVWNVYIR